MNTFVRQSLQFFYLLVEIGIEITIDKACMRFLQLVSIEVGENDSDII